jgi:NAD(P) transhydrogenase subunit alpha
MNATQTIQLFVFLLAGFVGFQTISRIPPLLHTPLMAATNAISGISLVASLVLAGSAAGVLATVLGTIAVGCAVTNVVGGFLITDRMLAMFKRTEPPGMKLADTTGASQHD